MSRCRAWSRRAWGRIVVTLAAACLPPAAWAQPPCTARVSVEPQRAYVEQQLLYAIEIGRREDVRSIQWARPPTAPGFRMEALPTRTDVAARTGAEFLAVEERRALFPARAGELRIPAATLRCILVSDRSERDVEVLVPSVSVAVVPVPEAGRPLGYDGLVGQLEVTSSVEPATLELGRAARLTVVVEGRANLWGLESPLDPGAPPIPALDVLPHPAELFRDAGRALRLRRTFAYDLVPRTPGAFEIPAIAIPYFDPRLERFRVATAGPLRVEVRPGVSAERARSAPGAAAAGQPSSPGRRRKLGWWLGAGASLVLGGWLWRRMRSRPRSELEGLLESAETAQKAGELERANALLARGLRTALETRLPGARSLSAQELLARASDEPELRQAVTMLAQLDDARFSGRFDHAPDPEAARGLVLRLARRAPSEP